MVKKTPVPVYRLLSSLSNKRIVLVSFQKTPCSSTVKCWVYMRGYGDPGPKVRYLRRLTVKWWCLPDGGWLGSAQILHNHLIGMGVNVQGGHVFRGAFKKAAIEEGWGAARRGNTELGG